MKTLIIATLLLLLAVPCFAGSFDTEAYRAKLEWWANSRLYELRLEKVEAEIAELKAEQARSSGGLRINIGGQAVSAIGDNLQRTDAGAVNWLVGGSYMWGETWHMLIDVDLPAGEPMPTALGFSYVLSGNAGDPQGYCGLFGISHMRDEATRLGAGGRLGVLLPLSGQLAKLGFKGYWVDQEGWFAGFEVQYVDIFGAE